MGMTREEKNARQREYYQKNRPAVLKRQKERDDMNRELLRANSRAYYAANREKLLPKQRTRNRTNYAKHTETYAKRSKAWQDKNPERASMLSRAWQARNPEYRAMYYKANREKARKDTRKRKLKSYGLDHQSYSAILKKQEGQCPICLRFLAEQAMPSVDHSHATGVVRGILCRKCNAALGLLEDSPANLERALEYLSIPRLHSFRRWLCGVTSMTNSAPSSDASVRLE